MPPAAVLMNIGMPDLDGCGTTKALRELQYEGALPPFNVIGYTVAWTPELRQECQRQGMLDCISFINPPLTGDRLRPHLQRACILH